MLMIADRVATVDDLLDAYVDCLDDDRLEEWPELFVEDGVYKIVSRENLALGLPAPLVYYYSRGMMRDRITAVRDALTFEFVYPRHMTADRRVTAHEDGRFTARSNLSLYQSTEEGRTRLYAVGQYRDEIVPTPVGPRFRERVLVLDSFAVLNLIAAPL